jgi:hypothetical protein
MSWTIIGRGSLTSAVLEGCLTATGPTLDPVDHPTDIKNKALVIQSVRRIGARNSLIRNCSWQIQPVAGGMLVPKDLAGCLPPAVSCYGNPHVTGLLPEHGTYLLEALDHD